jgi:hypothetical protein
MFANKFFLALAAVLALIFGVGDSASAAKKRLTYDQAYAKCKSIMDKEGTPARQRKQTCGPRAGRLV